MMILSAKPFLELRQAKLQPAILSSGVETPDVRMAGHTLLRCFLRERSTARGRRHLTGMPSRGFQGFADKSFAFSFLAWQLTEHRSVKRRTRRNVHRWHYSTSAAVLTTRLHPRAFPQRGSVFNACPLQGIGVQAHWLPVDLRGLASASIATSAISCPVLGITSRSIRSQAPRGLLNVSSAA